MKKKVFLFSTKKNRSLAKKEGSKTHPRKVIILMSMPTIIHTVTAVMDMPTEIEARSVRSQEIITACTDNSNVTITAAQITAITALLTVYDTAPSSVARNEAFPALHNGLKSFMSLFQTAANIDPAHAVSIIESGKFKVKNMSIAQKREFKAENGMMSGDVMLTAEGGPPGSVHNWKYSLDGIAYTWVRGTANAHTHINGFTRGAKVYFIHELSVHDEPQSQSQAFELTIN